MDLKLISLLILILLNGLSIQSKTEKDMGKEEFYCEYCGHRFPNVRLLVSGSCPRHPDGSNKGLHKLYEGSEKTKYTCKYCGKQCPSIQVMVGGTCPYHPKGSNKGAHAPAL